MHIHVNLQEGTAEYMALASEIRVCMRAYGIASITIQPEFLNASRAGSQHNPSKAVSGTATPTEHCLFTTQQSS